MTVGIESWGVYLPFWRLERSAVAAVLGSPAGRGSRSVASYDEDTTTLGVEAARRALAPLDGDPPAELLFSTPAPAYLDKTNATAMAGALDLPTWSGATDLLGSVRSAVGAVDAALALATGSRTLAVVADLRTGPAGGPEELDSGDGGVALVLGNGDDGPGGTVAAVPVGRAVTSAEFLDRWRIPGERSSHTWEDRFGAEVYLPLVEAAFADAAKRAGIVAADVAHLVVAGLHSRACRGVASAVGVAKTAAVPDRASVLGNLGAAQAGLGLADALERAEPGEVIAVVVVADGASVLLLRATDALPAVRDRRRAAGLATVEELVAQHHGTVPYARFLTWRGALDREPPRRPDPERPGAPATWRSHGWKEGFHASQCRACGFRHLPPSRVCLKCHSVDEMDPVRLADVTGRVATFTVDRLAFSLSPPVVGAVVDFDGGGRYRCEMTDVDPDTIAAGAQVAMTFRRLYTAEGAHNYFWKARPVEPPSDPDDQGGDQS